MSRSASAAAAAMRAATAARWAAICSGCTSGGTSGTVVPAAIAAAAKRAASRSASRSASACSAAIRAATVARWAAASSDETVSAACAEGERLLLKVNAEVGLGVPNDSDCAEGGGTPNVRSLFAWHVCAHFAGSSASSVDEPQY